jgi:hypothetical protein
MKPLLNRNEIRLLLDKFYKGETTGEEEQKLRYYFHMDDVPSEFKAEKEIFRALHRARDMRLPDVSFNELFDRSIRNEERSNSAVRTLYSFKYRAVAAAIVLMLSVSGLLWWQLKPSATVQMADTYTDPEKAFVEAKRVLLKVSGNLNKGTTQLNNLSKFNTNLDKISTVQFFRPVNESRN